MLPESALSGLRQFSLCGVLNLQDNRNRLV